MVTLREEEICPKKDTCMFANGCHGLENRNSVFVCDLDFQDETVDFSATPVQCEIRL